MANDDEAADGLAAKLAAARDAHAALLPDDLMRPKLERLLVTVAPMLQRPRQDRGPKLQPRDYGLRDKAWIGADHLSLENAMRASREVAFAAMKQLLDAVWRKMDQKERDHKRRKLAHEVDGAHHTCHRSNPALVCLLATRALVRRSVHAAHAARRRPAPGCFGNCVGCFWRFGHSVSLRQFEPMRQPRASRSKFDSKRPRKRRLLAI